MSRGYHAGEQTLTARPQNPTLRAAPEAARRHDILYFDAQALTRDCITRELARKLPEFNIVGHALVQEMAGSEDLLHDAAVAILFVHRSGHEDGHPNHNGIGDELTALERLAQSLPRVMLAEAEMPEEILKAFQHRVRGYVPTTLPIDQMAEAIRFVAAGGTFVPQSILTLYARPSAAPTASLAAPDPNAVVTHFSRRQNQVLQLLWRGSSNKLIAYDLQMCESTVKVHIRHIMKKLKVSNRTQVVLKTRPQLLDEALAGGLNFASPEPASADPASPSGGVPTAEDGTLISPLERSRGSASRHSGRIGCVTLGKS